MRQAFASANHALKRSPLREAILAKSHVDAEIAVSPAVEAMEKTLTAKYPALLTRMIQSAGEVAGKHLVTQLLRARITASASPAIKLDYKLDVTNEKSVAWIKERALTLVKDVTGTTREALRDEILSAFEDQRTLDDIIKDIVSIIDDPNRAEVIARTETMDAANEGQQLLWEQAVDDGLLTGKELQVWIVTPDDRLCPICEPMDGETTELDGQFDVDGDQIDGPPAHPNCRCTIGLQLPS